MSSAVLSGAASGASAGSVGGIHGAIIGGIVGAGIGLWQDSEQKNAKKKAERKRRIAIQNAMRAEQGRRKQMLSMGASNPNVVAASKSSSSQPLIGSMVNSSEGGNGITSAGTF